MNYAKLRSKSSLIVVSAAVSATLVATDAAAQRRGGGGPGRTGGGGRTMGQAVPRGAVRGGGPRVVGSPRVVVGSPYRSYYYRSYYRPYYRPGISIGFYAGYPFYGYGYYGYPYGYYGRPYGYYGYPYGYGYGYGYGYAYPAVYGYGYGGDAYSGVRIQGAPPNAEVFADGYYVGIADDFDNAFQRLELTPGAHSIEIRSPGVPPVEFDVNIQPGRTVTLRVR
jgi:hypothetical protein